LSEDAVWMIVMNTPDALQLEARHGCPALELMPEGKYLMIVQFRNGCPVSESGLIDNYTVDRRTGQIWTGSTTRSISILNAFVAYEHCWGSSKPLHRLLL
jgi:hypothetical protein